MPSADHIRRVAERYGELLTAHDADGVASLYAEEAIVEDPAGNAPLVGKSEILAFYRGAIERARPERVAVTGPVRILADGMTAAVPLQSRSTRDGRLVAVDIIDVFTFDDGGLITSMRAYWGPENVNPA
jgi:steroid delta-isomerase